MRGIARPRRAAPSLSAASCSTNVVAVHSAVIVEFGVRLRAWRVIAMSPTLMMRGNLLTRSKNSAEVVVRAFGGEPIRHFGVERLLLLRRRREAQNRQVRLRRQPLDPAQHVGHVLLLRQHVAQALEPVLELGDLRLELRQPARRRDALVDVGAQRGQMRLPRVDVRLHFASRRSSRSRRRRRPQTSDERADLAVPRKFAEREFHVLLPIDPRAARLPRRRRARRVAAGAAGGGGGASGIVERAPRIVNRTMSPVCAVCSHLAVDDLDRPLEPGARLRGWRRSPTAPVSDVVRPSIVKSSPFCVIDGQPQPIGQRLADLVEHVHRAGLAAAQLLDQRDALLQLRLARLELLHLRSTERSCCVSRLGPGDLLVELAPMPAAATRTTSRCRARWR